MGGQPLIGTSARRVLKVHDKLVVGLSGLDGDVLTFSEDLSASLRLLAIEAGNAGHYFPLAPPSLAQLVSTKLYAERRRSPLQVEPIIAGLIECRDSSNKNENETRIACSRWIPYLCSQDSLGAPMVTRDFAVSGTCSPSLVGVCEALFRPDLSPDELWRVAARCLIGAMERDCLSGNGAVVHLITSNGITSHELSVRAD